MRTRTRAIGRALSVAYLRTRSAVAPPADRRYTPEFDADLTLRQLRELAYFVETGTIGNRTGARTMGRKFAELDAHLSSTGQLPKDWT